MALQKAAVSSIVAHFWSLPLICSVGILQVWFYVTQHTEPRSRTSVTSRILLSRCVSFEQISALISPCRFATKYFLFTIFFNPLKTMP